SIAILQPLDGTTVWGREVTVRWVAQDLGNLTDIPEGEVIYYLILKKGHRESLKKDPQSLISSKTPHTMDQTYTFKNLKEGPYTLFIFIGNAQGRLTSTIIQAKVQFRVLPTEKRGTTPLPDWAIFTALGVLIAAALWVSQRS
ncbi:MAG: hypothetical protein D6765_16790, partial [Bacteroidetes bacterium]